jgi:hypothetical protein
MGEPVRSRCPRKLRLIPIVQLGLSFGGARPADSKKGATKASTAALLHDEAAARPSKWSVGEGGTRRRGALRDLRGVLQREEAQIGVLITMKGRRPHEQEAASVGVYTSPYWQTTHRVCRFSHGRAPRGERIDFPVPKSKLDLQEGTEGASRSGCRPGVPA